MVDNIFGYRWRIIMIHTVSGIQRMHYFIGLVGYRYVFNILSDTVFTTRLDPAPVFKTMSYLDPVFNTRSYPDPVFKIRSYPDLAFKIPLKSL